MSQTTFSGIFESNRHILSLCVQCCVFVNLENREFIKTLLTLKLFEILDIDCDFVYLCRIDFPSKNE